MVYGYIRVSTAKQDTANQQYEICKYAKKNKLKINAFIKEKISGTKNYKKRKLGNLLYKLNKGDIIIASELTRFGRSLYMIMDVLNYCLSKECIVITIKDNFVLGESIESKVLAFAFGLAGEIERNLISERTKQALERRKKNGTKLGRPKGAKNKVNYLEKHYLQIEMYLSQNKSGLWLSKRYNVHYNTMYSFLKTHKLNSKKARDNRTLYIANTRNACIICECPYYIHISARCFMTFTMLKSEALNVKLLHKNNGG